jgi:UDP-glucose 4-epimerase
MELGRKRGHEMVSFDRSQGYDILGPLYQIEGDAVIHLAGVLGTAELFDSPDEAIQVTIVGSHRVMQRCIEVGAQYVGILMPDIFPSIYTATKIATARLATALHYSRGLRVNHVRAYNAFGAGQKYGHGHPQKIVPTFAVHAWHRHPLPIWGDGLQGVDLIHTSDLARMLLDAATLPGDDLIFDGGTGQELTVVQVARMVAQAAG